MRLSFVLVLLAFAANGMAQREPRLVPQTDAEIWLSTSIETKPFTKPSGRETERKFFKNFRTALELGYRGNENITSSKLFYSTIALKYKVNKWCRTATELRYNMRDKYTTNSFRLDLQATLSHEIGRVKGALRFTYQHEFIPVVEYRDILRARTSIAYNIPQFPLDPYVSVEPFYLLHYTGNHLVGMRYDVGAEWSIGKDSSFEFAARYDREVDLPDPTYRWIGVIGYSYYWRR